MHPAIVCSLFLRNSPPPLRPDEKLTYRSLPARLIGIHAMVQGIITAPETGCPRRTLVTAKLNHPTDACPDPLVPIQLTMALSSIEFQWSRSLGSRDATARSTSQCQHPIWWQVSPRRNCRASRAHPRVYLCQWSEKRTAVYFSSWRLVNMCPGTAITPRHLAGIGLTSPRLSTLASAQVKENVPMCRLCGAPIGGAPL